MVRESPWFMSTSKLASRMASILATTARARASAGAWSAPRGTVTIVADCEACDDCDTFSCSGSGLFSVSAILKVEAVDAEEARLSRWAMLADIAEIGR